MQPEFGTISDPHLLEIDSKSMEIWSQGALGQFWVAGCDQDVNRLFPYCSLGDPLRENVVPGVSFWTSQKSEMAPKPLGGGKIGTGTL